MNQLRGSQSGEGLRIAIVVSRFNAVICDRLYDGAIAELARLGVRDDDIDVIQVPGAFEICHVLGRLVAANRHDAIVTLGAVIRGETPHFDLIAAETARSVTEASRHGTTPVLFGVLTTDTMEQALARSGTNAGDNLDSDNLVSNKGCEAARGAVEMATLGRALRERFQS